MVTTGSPRVSVPVLSKARKRSLPRLSIAAPPLMSTPRLAAAVMPLRMLTGAEITSAQGQEMTSSASAR